MGAMYLFIINSLYIVLATLIIIKLLRFPLINYVNSSKRRLISRLVTLFSILMLIPAFHTFVGVLYKNKFDNSVKEFYNRELDGISNKDYLIRDSKIEYDIEKSGYDFYQWRDKNSTITFNNFGLEPLSNDIISLLKYKIKNYPHLSLTTVIFNQQEVKNDFKEQKRFLTELRKRDSLDLSSKTKQIELLEKKLQNLEKVQNINTLYKSVIEDIKFNYDEIELINLQNEVLIDNWDIDPVFLIKWKESVSESQIIKQEQKIIKWLSIKLETESFELKRLK